MYAIRSYYAYVMSAEPYAPVFDELVAVTQAGARIDFGLHFVIATADSLSSYNFV